MSRSARSTITIPKVRFDQLQAIADRRSLPNPAALIEAWIARAIEEGELPAGIPGFSAQVVGGEFLIRIAGTILPPMPIAKARMFAAILSAATGGSDPELDFTMPPGRPVALEWSNSILAIGRAGSGIRFVLRGKGQEGEGISIATSPGFVADLADTIRAEFPSR